MSIVNFIRNNVYDWVWDDNGRKITSLERFINNYIITWWKVDGIFVLRLGRGCKTLWSLSPGYYYAANFMFGRSEMYPEKFYLMLFGKYISPKNKGY